MAAEDRYGSDSVVSLSYSRVYLHRTGIPVAAMQTGKLGRGSLR
jgi:hypothetical protein